MAEKTSAIGLARYAREYYDSAIAADRVVGMKKGYEIHAPPPVMFLVAHSIELVLKSYLIHKGKTVDETIKLKHNLIRCFEAAEELGLSSLVQLNDTDKHVLGVINQLHVSTELRYIKTGFKEFPVFGPLQQVAEKLLDSICPLVGYR